MRLDRFISSSEEMTVFNSRIVIPMFSVCSFQRSLNRLNGLALVRFDLFMFFGGSKAVVRPDPIPNSAVKRSVADGSSSIGSARVGSRHSFKKAETRVSAFFFVRRNSIICSDGPLQLASNQ